MKTHVFQAHTMASAVAQIKASLGSDALILRTRTVRPGGILGGRKLVEITAAAEDGSDSAQPNAGSRPAASNRVTLPKLDVRDWLGQDEPPATTGLSRRTGTLFDRQPSQSQLTETRLSNRLQALFDSFVASYISPSLARQLLDGLPDDLELGSNSETNPLLRRIERIIPTAGPIEPGSPGKPRIISFIGPTGVGKTTSIAKLAAQYKLQRNTSVALLTIDTYRIAAVDQLRTYADIIDVPFGVVLTPSELAEQLSSISDHSLIFIDTTGRSPNDHLRLAELRSFHQVLGAHQTHLVLSATAAHSQIASAIDKFSPLGIDQLLLTKLDETVSLSPILNIFAERSADSPIPVSYVTAGQDVPADIDLASSHNIAMRILGEHCG